MSYQSSIHFDPTALLIIKKEVDNSVQLVESAVSSLVEDQRLPFDIDDALTQLEQCAHVLILIDMPHLARITEYCAILMRKIMQQPQQIKTSDVITLSEGTTMLKRYIEFSCLREVRVPQFLLDTLNRLEIHLGKALTPEGQAILPLLDHNLDHNQPTFELPRPAEQEKSIYVHKLYKLSLRKLLGQRETELDLQGIRLTGAYLASLSLHTASAQYWNLVHVAFSHIDQLILNEARLRSLIDIESNMARFLEAPERFQASPTTLANILSLCISQEDETAGHIRHQLNISDEQLTDTQLQVLSRHLYGPDYHTIHSISQLITEEMTQIRNDIEYNYQNMSEEKSLELKNKLAGLANVFKVLNLNEACQELKQQSELLSQQNMLRNENYAQQLMNSILSAMNSIGILERHHTSSRLQIPVNNINISLDRLDEAHQVLLNESSALIELSSQALIQFIQHDETTSLETIPLQLKEISGAMLFLGQKDAQQAFILSAEFLQHLLQRQLNPDTAQINIMLDVLASADMMINNLQNKQPVLQSMFHIALSGSQQLQPVA
ncbi:chemotaxis protein [Acinetobacter sp. WZC-1]|uniref:chemotaxis protein n=1 Tax=Acinetobacter sp. WZC-1 TaxID=3459034 RepID=UPI00403D5E2B